MAVNGTRFVGSSHWKIPRKSGKSKKVVPFSRLEFPNGMSCSIYVSRSLYQFQVHGRAPPRTGVYDQMEQLFTNRKFHFSYHQNFRVFFLNGKRPLKRWARFPGWNFRTKCRVPFPFLVVCTSSRFTVGHRDVLGFTTKWNNFLPIGNSTFATTEISGFFS